MEPACSPAIPRRRNRAERDVDHAHGRERIEAPLFLNQGKKIVGDQSDYPDWLRTVLKIAGAVAVVVVVPMLLHQWFGLPDSVVAETHRMEGKYDQAIQEFTAIINRYPGLSATAPCYNSRGQSYQGKGDLDRALADFDEAIRLQPNFSEASFNRCDARRR